jgi:hypothetical protein
MKSRHELEIVKNFVDSTYSHFGNKLIVDTYKKYDPEHTKLGFCFKHIDPVTGGVTYKIDCSRIGIERTDFRIMMHEYAHIYLGHLDGIHEELDVQICNAFRDHRPELIEIIVRNCGIDEKTADRFIERVIDDPELNHEIHNIAMDMECNSSVLSKEDVEEMEMDISSVLPKYEEEALEKAVKEAKSEDYKKELEDRLHQMEKEAKIKLMIPERYYLEKDADGNVTKTFPNDLSYEDYLLLIILHIDQFVKMLVSIEMGGNGETKDITKEDIQNALSGMFKQMRQRSQQQSEAYRQGYMQALRDARNGKVDPSKMNQQQDPTAGKSEEYKNGFNQGVEDTMKKNFGTDDFKQGYQDGYNDQMNQQNQQGQGQNSQQQSQGNQNSQSGNQQGNQQSGGMQSAGNQGTSQQSSGNQGAQDSGQQGSQKSQDYQDGYDAGQRDAQMSQQNQGQQNQQNGNGGQQQNQQQQQGGQQGNMPPMPGSGQMGNQSQPGQGSNPGGQGGQQGQTPNGSQGQGQGDPQGQSNGNGSPSSQSGNQQGEGSYQDGYNDGKNMAQNAIDQAQQQGQNGNQGQQGNQQGQGQGQGQSQGDQQGQSGQGGGQGNGQSQEMQDFNNGYQQALQDLANSQNNQGNGNGQGLSDLLKSMGISSGGGMGQPGQGGQDGGTQEHNKKDPGQKKGQGREQKDSLNPYEGVPGNQDSGKDHQTDSRDEADKKREAGQIQAGGGVGMGRGGGPDTTREVDKFADDVDMALSEVLNDIHSKVVKSEVHRDMMKLYNRGINRSVIAPSLSRKISISTKPKLVFLIDISGSMDTRLIDRILNTIAKSLKKLNRDLRYDIITWSTRLGEHIKDIDPRYSIPRISCGGGTEMAGGMRYFKEHYGPEAILVLISDFCDSLDQWHDVEKTMRKYSMWGFNYGDNRYSYKTGDWDWTYFKQRDFSDYGYDD